MAPLARYNTPTPPPPLSPQQIALDTFTTSVLELNLTNRVLTKSHQILPDFLSQVSRFKLRASASPRAPSLPPPVILPEKLKPSKNTSLKSLPSLSSQASVISQIIFTAYSNADPTNDGYAVLTHAGFLRFCKDLFKLMQVAPSSSLPSLAFSFANAAGRFSGHDFDPRLTIYEFHTALAYLADKLFHRDPYSMEHILPSLELLSTQPPQNSLPKHILDAPLTCSLQAHLRHSLKLIFDKYQNEELPNSADAPTWHELEVANSSMSLREFLRFGRDFNFVPRLVSVVDAKRAYFAASEPGAGAPASPRRLNRTTTMSVNPVEPRLNFAAFERAIISCAMVAMRLEPPAPPPPASSFAARSAQAAPSRTSEVTACKHLFAPDAGAGSLPGFSPRLSPRRLELYKTANADPLLVFTSPLVSPRVRVTPGAAERVGCATARLQHRNRAGLSPRQVTSRVVYDPRGGLPTLSHPTLDESLALWELREEAKEAARVRLSLTAKALDKRRMRARQLERTLVESKAVKL